jgi:dTDP-4-amino-4,6-dideoxygalactose transaminase
VNEVMGFNSRLDPIQAAVLRVKLQWLDEWNARRKKIAGIYDNLLKDSGLVLPYVLESAESAWHLYVVRHPQRDALQKAMSDADVGSLIHYPIPPHLQQAYSHLGLESKRFPIAENMAEQVLSLPMGPHLSTAQAEEVASKVRQISARLNG